MKYVVRGIGDGAHATRGFGIVREGDIVECEPEVAAQVKWLRDLPYPLPSPDSGSAPVAEEPPDEGASVDEVDRDPFADAPVPLRRLIKEHDLTSDSVIDLGRRGLMEIDGIGPSRADALLALARGEE